jgi:hypothetical protein
VDSGQVGREEKNSLKDIKRYLVSFELFPYNQEQTIKRYQIVLVPLV